MSFLINSFIIVTWASFETPLALLHPTTPAAPLNTPDFRQSVNGLTVPAGSIWEFTTLSNWFTTASTLYPTVAPDFNSGISTFDLSLFLKFKIASLTIALASSSACSSI